MTILDDALSELRRICKEELAGSQATVYLFGSAAKGTMSRTSDIDIGVSSEVSLLPGQLSQLRDRIENSQIPYRVEVVLLEDTDQSFRDRVIHEGERWIG